MKWLRTFILLLLCAVLPLSGLAASGLTGECPMQQTMSMDTGFSMSTDMPGCDLMKSASIGKAKGVFCKVTAQCQFGSLYHPAVQANVSRPAALVHPVIFHYADSLPVRDPNGVWRPPRLI